MQRIGLFLKLMFSLNKNLFFERMPFLKSQSAVKNTVGYGIWFVLKEHILSWVCLFLVLNLLNHGGFACGLLCLLLFVKLLRVDNLDWKLYFRNDFGLACPSPDERFLTVLGGNLVKALLFDDFTPLYPLVFVLFTPMDVWMALAVYGFFVALYVFALTYYFLLETGPLWIKKVYSFLSYAGSMVSTFAVIYMLLGGIISLVSGIDFATFKDNPMQVIDTLIANVTAVADWIRGAVIAVDGWWWLLAVVSLVAVMPTVYTVFRRKEANTERGDSGLLFPKWLDRCHRRLCKTPFRAALFSKEIRLFSHLYHNNFRQYWFAVFLDRSVATMAAIFLSLQQFAVPNAGVIFFCLATVMLTLDVSSQVGVKMITNLSFIADFNTLRTANTNGADLRELVRAKLRFFYGVRLMPTLLSCALYAWGMLALGAPWWAVLLLAATGVFVLWVYPLVYLTNNLINTKMDYRDYEKYLEESKILDSGVNEFMPLNLTYNTKIVLLLAGVVAALLLPDVPWLFAAEAAAMAVVGLTDHWLMKRILRNILLFIQGGDYSANIKKIFSPSRPSR